MAGEHPGDTTVSVSLPESVSHWLDEKAQEEGRSREDILRALLSAHRQIDGLDGNEIVGSLDGQPATEGDPTLPGDLRAEVDAAVEEQREELEAYVDEQLADREPPDAGAVEERIDDLESRFIDLLEDVRDRVIQVKREADGKADADHDHPELDAALTKVEDLEAGFADLESRVGSVADRLDSGFENYEEVLEYLADSVDDVSARQTTLAKALIETRNEIRKLAARDTARSAAEKIKRTASRHGVSKATCEACNGAVDIGLLTRAECPHCSATFVDVEPSSGFFGKSTIETGKRPALGPGDDDGFEFGVGEIAESEPGIDKPDDATDATDDREREAADDHERESG